MFRIALLFLTLFKAYCHCDYKYQLSVCAIFRDEGPYLREWIEFHRLVGVEHFYLYNHCSGDQYLDVLRPYILGAIVELRDRLEDVVGVKEFVKLQCRCYTECLEGARGVSKWVAFIDSDEFLFPSRERDLVDVLEEYQRFGGIAVNSLMFGTSGLRKIDRGKLLIESLTSCASKGCLKVDVKSIVRPERVMHFDNPHQPVFKEEFFLVNTDRLPFEGVYSSDYHQAKKLRINHYWTRGEDYFFNKKIPRQRRWGGKPDPKQILYYLNAEKDEAILRFVPALKKVMGFKDFFKIP